MSEAFDDAVQKAEQNIEELKGVVTLRAERDALKAELENQHSYTLGVIDSSQRSIITLKAECERLNALASAREDSCIKTYHRVCVLEDAMKIIRHAFYMKDSNDLKWLQMNIEGIIAEALSKQEEKK